MYVCMYVYVHMYVCVSAQTSVHMYVCMRLSANQCSYVCICTYVCMRLSANQCSDLLQMNPTCMCKCICIHTHAYMHTCIHAYMHTCIHASYLLCRVFLCSFCFGAAEGLHIYLYTYTCTYIHAYIVFVPPWSGFLVRLSLRCCQGVAYTYIIHAYTHACIHSFCTSLVGFSCAPFASVLPRGMHCKPLFCNA
jgi:hypothetical protein